MSAIKLGLSKVVVYYSPRHGALFALFTLILIFWENIYHILRSDIDTLLCSDSVLLSS